MDGSLTQAAWEAPVASLRRAAPVESIECGDLRISFSPSSLAFAVKTARDKTIQNLSSSASISPMAR
jgi:hypothetical protein